MHSEEIADRLLSLSQDIVRQTDQVLLERLGIGLSQLKIMKILQDNPATSQRQIADRLNQTEAAVSRQIKLMQQRGWLQTTTDPEEKRRRLAKLTPSGQKLALAAQETQAEQYRNLFKNLIEKQQLSLLNLLNLLND